MESKTCTKCGRYKPLSQFYRHKSSRGGYNSRCKVCIKEDVDNYRARDKAKYRKALRRYRKTHVGQYSVYHEKWKRRNRHKVRCCAKLQGAIRYGRIERPERCEVCGITGIIHGHHEDYSEPYDVKWLCQECHTNLHKELRNAG